MAISVSDEIQRDEHFSSDINNQDNVLQHTVSSDIANAPGDDSRDPSKKLEPLGGMN
jgi:hypothetical protein